MTKLSFPDFGEEQRKRLSDAGIPFQLLDKKTSTIVIDSSNLQAMLDLLGTDAERSSTESKFEGVVAMRLGERRPLPRPLREVTHAEIKDNAERARYVLVCGKRIEKLTKQAEKTSDKLRKKLVTATARMFSVWRKEAFPVADDACRDASERRERLTAEFEALKSAAHVQSVQTIGDTVVVRTDVLKAIDPKTGDAHAIGRFAIFIDLKGRNGVVRWFNIDKRVDAFMKGMNAPNVFADGSACLGDTAQPMAELTARLELSVVVDLAIQFIENAGNDELGAYVNLWPRHW